MKKPSLSRILVHGVLAAALAFSASCGPLGGGTGGGNHRVVDSPGLRNLGAQLRDAGNGYRRANGKSTLTRHAGLEAMAQEHAESMARSGRLGHEGSSMRDGKARAEYKIGTTAENALRYGVGNRRDAQGMLKVWTDSSGHRGNLLGSYAVTGLGIAQDELGNIWASQMFGSAPGSSGGGGEGALQRRRFGELVRRSRARRHGL